MSTTNQVRTSGSLPSSLLNGIMLMFFAGSFATIVFDIWGQVISPGLLDWSRLAPVPLATQTIQVLFGFRAAEAGHFMHLFVVGLVGYPLGWIYIFRPIQERILPQLPLFISSAIYGFGLFIVAIGIVAGPLLAGNPWFLNWTAITYVALIGHVLYGIVVAYATDYLERKGLN